MGPGSVATVETELVARAPGRLASQLRRPREREAGRGPAEPVLSGSERASEHALRSSGPRPAAWTLERAPERSNAAILIVAFQTGRASRCPKYCIKPFDPCRTQASVLHGERESSLDALRTRVLEIDIRQASRYIRTSFKCSPHPFKTVARSYFGFAKFLTYKASYTYTTNTLNIRRIRSYLVLPTQIRSTRLF